MFVVLWLAMNSPAGLLKLDHYQLLKHWLPSTGEMSFLIVDSVWYFLFVYNINCTEYHVKCCILDSHYSAHPIQYLCFLYSVLACEAVLASLEHLCSHWSDGESGTTKVMSKLKIGLGNCLQFPTILDYLQPNYKS